MTKNVIYVIIFLSLFFFYCLQNFYLLENSNEIKEVSKVASLAQKGAKIASLKKGDLVCFRSFKTSLLCIVGGSLAVAVVVSDMRHMTHDACQRTHDTKLLTHDYFLI